MESDYISQFWEQKLRGLVLNDLPYGHANPKSNAKRHTLELKVSDDISPITEHFVLDNDNAFFALSLTVFKILIYRYCGQPDGTIMIPVGLYDSKFNNVVDKILPAQTKVQGGTLVSDLFREILLEIRELQKYSQGDIGNLIKDLKKENKATDQILFTLETGSENRNNLEHCLTPPYDHN